MNQFENVLSPQMYNDLAEKTAGFSGSDLKGLCTNAHIRSQMKVLVATRFCKVKKSNTVT